MTDDSEAPPTAEDVHDVNDRSLSLEDRTARLHEHLEATAELPIDRETNRWIGEAEALARDLATNDLDAETTRERVATIRDLLSEAGETNHAEADDHLDASRRLCDAILDDAA